MNQQQIIEQAWEQRNQLTLDSHPGVAQVVQDVLMQLDNGSLRVAEKDQGNWVVHQWIKKAILLSFRLRNNQLIFGGPQVSIDHATSWFDKVPLKCAGWSEQDFKNAGFRSVPGSIIRHSAYIGQDTVIMPSFINVGARIGDNTMIDTWVTIGSCAQVGAHCHISGGVGIGGVLEPLQANPVIIEDHCFIGARSEVAEGVIIEEGAVLAMGVFIGASTKIIERHTGKIYQGRVPAYSVVVPGTLPPSQPGGPALSCAVIVKQVDAQTRSKTSINELLRA
jgi:2,3,4,5-tetrahydropyridine-2,6-dicarboxylate N-succinyltransferase